jgi:peptidoglycan/LPS O-acetylase OafA/YrhL
MSPGARKLVGMAVLLPGIALYLALAATLADLVPDHWLAKLLYFAVAGVIWAFPAGHIFRWMNRPPKGR